MTFLQKMAVIWEKSKFLTLMKMEQAHIEETYWNIITRDVADLREKLGELKKKENNNKKVDPTTQKEIAEIEANINETEKYRQMIESGKDKSKDLERQIKLYKKLLWRK